MNEPLDSQLFSQPEAKSEPSGNGAKVFIRDLEDGQSVETIFLVRDRQLAKKRNGEHFLRVDLADASGALAGVCWDEAEALHALAKPGQAVLVHGRFAVSERYGPQLTIKKIAETTEADYELADLVERPSVDAAQMEADLRQLIETIRNPHLRLLLDALYGERSDTWQKFKLAPAAKYYHEAYVHGLLQHTLSVGQGVNAMSASFPGVDRDLAVTGALIHDIGKIEAYASDGPAIDMTDDGRLLGEIPLGYYLVRREIEQIDGFPWTLARALLHIVLSHHGKLENGSPVAPMTREAVVVHTVDNLGGQLGSYDRIEKSLQDGEVWSGFDRALSGSAYFPARAKIGQVEDLPAASGS